MFDEDDEDRELFEKLQSEVTQNNNRLMSNLQNPKSSNPASDMFEDADFNESTFNYFTNQGYGLNNPESVRNEDIKQKITDAMTGMNNGQKQAKMQFLRPQPVQHIYNWKH